MKLKIEPIQIGVAGENLAAGKLSWILTKKTEGYFSANHVYMLLTSRDLQKG